MIINSFMLMTASAVSFLTGAALAALVCTSRRSGMMRRLVTDSNAYLDNETERAEAVKRMASELSLLTAQTRDVMTENTKLMRILRNIVDPKSLGQSRVRKRTDASAAKTEKTPKTEKTEKTGKTEDDVLFPKIA